MIRAGRGGRGHRHHGDSDPRQGLLLHGHLRQAERDREPPQWELAAAQQVLQ